MPDMRSERFGALRLIAKRIDPGNAKSAQKYGLSNSEVIKSISCLLYRKHDTDADCSCNRLEQSLDRL